MATIMVVAKSMHVYPNALLLTPGTRLHHAHHGTGVVARKTRKSEGPYCVWLKMDSDGVVGTVDIRLCRWPNE